MRFRVEPQSLFKKKPKLYADQDWKTDDKIPITDSHKKFINNIYPSLYPLAC